MSEAVSAGTEAGGAADGSAVGMAAGRIGVSKSIKLGPEGGEAIPGVGARRSVGFGGGGVAGGGAALAAVLEVSVLASEAASASVSAMIFLIENFSGIAGSCTGRMAGAPSA